MEGVALRSDFSIRRQRVIANTAFFDACRHCSLISILELFLVEIPSEPD